MHCLLCTICGVRYVANLMITYGGTVQMWDATYVIKPTPPTLVHRLMLANACQWCEKTNHSSALCNNVEGLKLKTSCKSKCFRCGRFGHIAVNCNKMTRMRRKRFRRRRRWRRRFRRRRRWISSWSKFPPNIIDFVYERDKNF